MKSALKRRRMTIAALTERVAGELDPKPSADQVGRWLKNQTRVPAEMIAPLARAVGVDPLEMLAAHGIVEHSMASVMARLAASERWNQRLRALLAEQHRVAGGALFTEQALRDGRWAATAMPHWRGRRLSYHFADYVFLARVNGLFDRDEASRVFEEAFQRTGAGWDDGPFDGDTLLAPGWRQERLYVPRLAAARAAAPYASRLDGCRGVVIAGPRWAGMYSVAALLSVALGWGLDSFDMQARSLRLAGEPTRPLANELLRGWLDAVGDVPYQVWAHILTGEADIGAGETPPADVRLLAGAPADVQVILLVPEDQPGGEPAGNGPSALSAAAALTDTAPERLRATIRGWSEAMPRRPGLAHLRVPTARGSEGQLVGPSDPGYLDSYFDAAVEVAVEALRLLAAGGPVRAVVPVEAAASDSFAALAARA